MESLYVSLLWPGYSNLIFNDNLVYGHFHINYFIQGTYVGDLNYVTASNDLTITQLSILSLLSHAILISYFCGKVYIYVYIILFDHHKNTHSNLLTG